MPKNARKLNSPRNHSGKMEENKPGKKKSDVLKEAL